MVKFLRSGCLDHRMFGNGHPCSRDELLSKRSVKMTSNLNEITNLFLK